MVHGRHQWVLQHYQVHVLIGQGIETDVAHDSPAHACRLRRQISSERTCVDVRCVHVVHCTTLAGSVALALVLTIIIMTHEYEARQILNKALLSATCAGAQNLTVYCPDN